jgi:hypothetical protein
MVKIIKAYFRYRGLGLRGKQLRGALRALF